MKKKQRTRSQVKDTLTADQKRWKSWADYAQQKGIAFLVLGGLSWIACCSGGVADDTARIVWTAGAMFLVFAGGLLLFGVFARQRAGRRS